MTLQYEKRILAASWIIAVTLLAIVGPPLPVPLIAVVAFVPAIVMLHFWKEQPQTVSEVIQQSRR